MNGRVVFDSPALCHRGDALLARAMNAFDSPALQRGVGGALLLPLRPAPGAGRSKGVGPSRFPAINGRAIEIEF